MTLDFARLIERAKRDDVYEPVGIQTIQQAEHLVGFEFPTLLRRLYTEAGDGGFGPGYGFYGLMEGTDEFPDETVVGLYQTFRKGDPEDPLFVWPEKLLPVMDWGCAIRSCVDCSNPALPVVRFDPNWETGKQFNPEKMNFDSWLEAWLDGKDLW